MKQKGDMELRGTAFPSPHNQCWPEPTPYTLSIQLGMRMIQFKCAEWGTFMHMADLLIVKGNQNDCDSVGHYEADTLVIDTIGQKVGPLSMVDRFGTPFSTALHVIERYRLIACGLKIRLV